MRADEQQRCELDAFEATLPGFEPTILGLSSPGTSDVDASTWGASPMEGIIEEADARGIMPGLEGRCLDGRYVVRELIGEGACGRVYRAEQVALNRNVAIKVMGPVSGRDADLVRQFHDEAFAASRLLHPNIVSTFDHGHTPDGLLYIVMEHVRGRTLAEVSAKEGPLSAGRAMDLAVQILGGLEAAHAAGVVHADLKSENIMVEDLCGAGELVKVIDFSIARFLRGARNSRLWQRSEGRGLRVAGTPQYMAPEVISGIPPTEQADIYAVGVLLYQLVTGELPFSGESSLDIMMQHLEEPVARPRERFAGLAIPVELERIILRALAKEPEHRFASAASFRKALLALRCKAHGRAQARSEAAQADMARCTAPRVPSPREMCAGACRWGSPGSTSKEARTTRLWPSHMMRWTWRIRQRTRMTARRHAGRSSGCIAACASSSTPEAAHRAEPRIRAAEWLCAACKPCRLSIACPHDASDTCVHTRDPRLARGAREPERMPWRAAQVIGQIICQVI